MNQYRLHFIVAIFIPFLLISPAHLVLQGFGIRNVDLGPDMIIHNGSILTMEQSPAQVEAVAIQGESIFAVGDETEILAMSGSNTRFIDLGGRTLLPGFIDTQAFIFTSLTCKSAFLVY